MQTTTSTAGHSSNTTVHTNGTAPGNSSVTTTFETKVCSTAAPEGLFTAVFSLFTMTIYLWALAVHRLVDWDVVSANTCIFYSKNTKLFKIKGLWPLQNVCMVWQFSTCCLVTCAMKVADNPQWKGFKLEHTFFPFVVQGNI